MPGPSDFFLFALPFSISFGTVSKIRNEAHTIGAHFVHGNEVHDAMSEFMINRVIAVDSLVERSFAR